MAWLDSQALGDLLNSGSTAGRNPFSRGPLVMRTASRSISR
jgi:hypothetical protein